MTGRFQLRVSDAARTRADRLTLREALLQVTVPALVHLDRERLEGYGGIFLHGGMEQDERDTIVARVRAAAAVEPFVVSDIEAGPTDWPAEFGVEFGTMMGHGVADDPSLTESIGRVAGAWARHRGITWALGPCVDFAVNPDSPMVSTRSAGSEPRRVARVTGAFARGLQESGLLATAKHFPGDGFGSLDQHLTTPNNPLSVDAWRAGPGAVYRQLIDDGIRAIMPGHIALPALDEPDATNGLFPPATLSRRLMTGLLKQELGFEGLIVSDAVNMGGFCGFMPYYDACALFLENGGDMLLFAKVDEHYFREMERCVRERKLSEATLRLRAARVIAAKEQLGLLAAPSPSRANEEFVFDGATLASLAERFRAATVCVLRDRAGALPLRLAPASRLLHVVIANNLERHRPLLAEFTAELCERHANVTEWVDPGCDRLFLAAREREFAAIVVSVAGGIDYGANVIRTHGPVARNMMHGWMKLGVPTVFVAHQHPFLHREYEAAVDCCVATFGSTRYSLGRLAAGLFGGVILPRVEM